ncbi:MAG: hypothetical protein WEB59_07475 [Thermoanaerobaculia bacterium]
MSRRAAAGAAALLLLAFVLASQAWAELPRRVRSLAAFAPKELAVRRLGGSGTAFDRRFFSFLENARRRIPRSARGVAIFGAPDDEARVYLAAYTFAPLPVMFGSGSGQGSPGWVAVMYGPPPPGYDQYFARFPEGYLIGVPP